MEYYDASASAASTGPDATDLLRELGRSGVEDALEQSLARMDELLTELDAHDADETAPPEVVAVLEALTGAETAPITYASLHRRVHDGLLTWDDFWRHPEREADGVRLLREAMRVATESLVEGLSAIPDSPTSDQRREP